MMKIFKTNLGQKNMKFNMRESSKKVEGFYIKLIFKLLY
jgi:hypothetical protein